MTQLKDVIHFYLKCWGTVTEAKEGWENGEWVLTGKRLEAFLMGDLKFTPHLRSLQSMTEAQFNEIRMELSVDILHAHSLPPTFSDKAWHVIVLENRVQTNTLKFNDGLVLIKYGYDIFKLIPTKQAIDADTL